MGIYDRDYYRHDGASFAISGPRTVVGALVLANVAVYLIDVLVTQESHSISNWLACSVGTLTTPLYWWRFLTYGFAHSYDPQHIVLNMFGLWILGRDVEQHYGSREFLRLYLVLLVFGSVVWAVAGKLSGVSPHASLIGASGAVAGIVVLYAANFPHRTLLLFFVLPVPAWFAGVLIVVMDAYGMVRAKPDDPVAYLVHLAGASLAFTYYRAGWNFGDLTRRIRGESPWRWWKSRPKLKLHDPDDLDEDDTPLPDDEEVDRILEKISREGESSLTRGERRTLQNASRRYQKRREGDHHR